MSFLPSLALAVFLLVASSAHAQTTQLGDLRAQEQRLSFQTSGPWSPRVHLNADVAMVYGINQTLPERMKSWREHGYITQLMTGVAWGEYQDYLYGRWDGKNHEDEAQTEKSGAKISHGRDVYYMSPGPSYGEYLSVGVRKATRGWS